jgi:hypothetical protein
MDKNFLRNFSYVRVKIGSQDLALVPNTRIAEIKGGFYELQYTRELCDPTPTPGTRIVVADANQGDGTGNGSPKRQRTGKLDPDAGSQSAPPKVNGNTDRNNASHRQTIAAIFVTSEKSTGKRKLFETDTLECAMKDKMESVVHDINTGASGSMPPIGNPQETTHLSDSFASRFVSLGQASSSASVSPSYAHFLHTLTKSGSDKAYMFQKQYRKELGPIIEATNECDISDEKVDYEGSDSEDAATSVQYINPGQGILALAVPTLRREGNVAIVMRDLNLSLMAPKKTLCLKLITL